MGRTSLSPWLERPAYWAIRAALGAMGTGDLNANVHRAQVLGRFFGSKIQRKRLVRAMDNLKVAFPGWDEARRREYAILSYEHLFTLAVEMAYTPRMLSEEAWSDHLRIGNLAGAVRHLVSGKPAVMVTGHCGSWELMGYMLALLGFPLYALYRPLDLKPLDDWVQASRRSRGLVLVDKFGATEELPRLLDGGGAAAFIADQNAGDKGLFVPFFGRLASTYKTIGLLAMRYDAPILCGQARRLVWERNRAEEHRASRADDDVGELGFTNWHGEAMRYRIDVVDVIQPEDWKSQPDPLFYVTARYRRALEAMVRRAPEQNLWMHRYWKSRPRHERENKPMPGALKEKLRALPWMTDEEMGRIEEWSARDTRALAEAKA
jgi:KDO2-lipid IV(A) lauroyltransferase